MEQIELAITIIGYAISLITSILAVIYGIKTGQWKNVAKNIQPITEDTMYLIDLIETAESREAFKGPDKLEFVLTKFQAYCIENKKKFDAAEITDQVNMLVELSDKVNSKKIKYI